LGGGTSQDDSLHRGERLELHQARAVGVRVGSRRRGSGGGACGGMVVGGRMLGVDAWQVARCERGSAGGVV